MTYALSVADLTYLDRSMFVVIASGIVGRDSPVVEVAKGRVDGYAVVCDGPGAADEKRMAVFLDVLDRAARNAGLRRPLRVYRQGPRGGWSRA